MKIAQIFVGSLVVALSGCSSSTAQDPGLVGTGTSVASSAPDKNPDGVDYPPASTWGTVPRNGSRAGSTIQNFKFVGYPEGDPTKGLQPVSLAQYFDPSGQHAKLIHIQASGAWCSVCRAEATSLEGLGQQLADRKVVWLMTLAEGPTAGQPSKTKDLDNWLAEFKSDRPHVLDPGNKNLGPFYDAAALPWNANVDAKTMEILSSQTGANVDPQAILEELDGWIAKIDSGEIK